MNVLPQSQWLNISYLDAVVVLLHAVFDCNTVPDSMVLTQLQELIIRTSIRLKEAQLGSIRLN